MKKIVFVTGTRADFGKLKSLISISQESKKYEVHIFATGMHLNEKYGYTIDELYKSGLKNISKFTNHDIGSQMDLTLAKTIEGFSNFVADKNPDLIIVHGDRLEALAASIVGGFRNILVAHIEGGEVSGTIDEHIRHAITKMAHIHFVANEDAKRRLLQLGEYEESIFILGSPDLDLMNPNLLSKISTVKDYYEIPFSNYSIAIFHPVTTEYSNIEFYADEFFSALLQTKLNYIIIYPNNDLGSDEILTSISKLELENNFKIYPSIRFEYFLTLLKHADFIVGNSSAGVREAPYYNVPTIDVGARQLNRAQANTIRNVGHLKKDIVSEINRLINRPKNELDNTVSEFGTGNSDKKFLKLLDTNKIWFVSPQKQFQDLKK